ncbi:hypothetical protein AB0C90_32705 [Streptomyces sp. NPDC048550]|uniref:hypothetical protein n=1 Tax=unclassified Streptomyces TaxID=2593676 RepID=UPI00343C9899
MHEAAREVDLELPEAGCGAAWRSGGRAFLRQPGRHGPRRLPQRPPGAALARFRLGLRAAVLLVPGDARLLAAGTAFVDEFPEYRYV